MIIDFGLMFSLPEKACHIEERLAFPLLAGSGAEEFQTAKCPHCNKLQ